MGEESAEKPRRPPHPRALCHRAAWWRRALHPAACDSRGGPNVDPGRPSPRGQRPNSNGFCRYIESGCWAPSFNSPLNGFSVAGAVAPGTWTCARDPTRDRAGGGGGGGGWNGGRTGPGPGGRCSIRTPKPRAAQRGGGIRRVCSPCAPPAWTPLKGAALSTLIRLSAHAAMRRGEKNI